MATLDEIVAGLIAFRDSTYTRLNTLQDTLDALMDPTKKTKIYIDCRKCHGDGLVWATGGEEGVDPIDLGGIPPPTGTPGQMTCPLCKGAKRFAWGWIETNPEDAP